MKSDKIIIFIIGIGTLLLLVLLAWDALTPPLYETLTINPYAIDWRGISFSNIDVNSLIQSLLSALVGFMLTIFIVERLLRQSREQEIKYKQELQFQNISKILLMPLIRYRRSTISLLCNYSKNNQGVKKVHLPIKSSDLIYVFMPQTYVDEPLSQTNIEFYASTVKELKLCITNILLNVDLSNNHELSQLLSNYISFVTICNPCDAIIDMKNMKVGTEKLTDVIKRDLPSINLDSLGKSNLYTSFKMLKDLIEYHEHFFEGLYLLIPTIKID